MVISFLQMRQRLAAARRMAEGSVTQNLGCMLIEFLSLYGNALNYQDVGLSILDGGKYFSKRNMGPEWNNPSRFEPCCCVLYINA
jgi:non-canonical poly(A) RNA polymerase PAPD5/7